MYLNNIVKEYNNYRLNGERITESAYKLYINMWEDKNTEWKEKDLYTVFYNIEEEEEKIIWERKYNNSETVDGNFFICIDAVVYVSREDDREEDDTEDIEEYHIKQSVTVDECVICYKPPPPKCIIF